MAKAQYTSYDTLQHQALLSSQRRRTYGHEGHVMLESEVLIPQEWVLQAVDGQYLQGACWCAQDGL